MAVLARSQPKSVTSEPKYCSADSEMMSIGTDANTNRLDRARLFAIMPMTPESMGRKGGKVKSPAKARAAADNLKLARKVLKKLRQQKTA